MKQIVKHGWHIELLYKHDQTNLTHIQWDSQDISKVQEDICSQPNFIDEMFPNIGVLA